MSVYPPGLDVRRTATLSPDGLYRYALTRRWAQDGPPAQFVMLNPSTADDALDDPTIRRCVGFAVALGCAGIVVVNLYAYRATKPRDLWQAADPVGPDADVYLGVVARRAAAEGAPLIAAWGTHAKPERVAQVRALVAERGAELTALGVTIGGAPRHPLYLPAGARPSPWPSAETHHTDCRECREGKHVNCSGWHIDPVTDEVVEGCGCADGGHL